MNISIHALLAESDFIFSLLLVLIFLFLSTLSLRRATVTVLGIQHRVGISIHALLAESDTRRASRQQPAGISIHALLAESDLRHCTTYLNCSRFLSTLSLRRATLHLKKKHCMQRISIHALLAESDRLWTILYSCPGNFYPRSPCGERQR